MDAKQKLAEALLLPFNPKTNTAQDVGFGGPSTEYLSTDMHPKGGAFNYPTIWWDEAGNPISYADDPKAAMARALAYEEMVGRRFPYYNDTLADLEAGPSQSAAIKAAIDRSASGGASRSPLMGWPSERSAQTIRPLRKP